MSELNTSEVSRLEVLEGMIDAGMRSFMEVGAALAEIRENRLYRAQYETFEDYCQRRWRFTASRGRQLMSAVEAIASLSDEVQKPTNASQANALAAVDLEDRDEAWGMALQTAEEEGRPVTAKDVQNASRRLVPTESLSIGATNMMEVEPLFREALDALKKASDAADALSRSNAKAWLLTSGSALLKHLRDARDHVRGAKPASVCPEFDGESCNKCLGVGWVNKTRLESLSK